MTTKVPWTRKEDEILITFVKNHDALYNVKNKNHRKSHLKQALWREIALTLNKSDYDCVKRWTYVRDYYVRRRSKPVTDASGEAAKRRAILLSFLDNYTSSPRNTVVTTSILEDDYEYESEIKDALTDNEENSRSHKEEIVMSDDLSKCMYTNEENIDIDNTEELDETDLFFQAMAKIVKKLPRFEQTKLRMQISSLVGNAELRSISDGSLQNTDPIKIEY